MTYYEYMIGAAEQSRYNARHWFRYLRKVIFESTSYLTDEDVNALLNSEELTLFQKITLKSAIDTSSPTHDYVISLNKPTELRYFNQLMEKMKNE